jgi:hypothetical protein
MVFLPAIRAAQAESDFDGSGSANNNASDGPGPSSVSSPRFAMPMAPPTGPVIRKQNIACDACRSRKIRCQRMTIDQVVRHYSISDVDMPRDWKQTDSSVSNARDVDRNVLPTTSFSLLLVRIKRDQVQRGGGKVIMREMGKF